MDSRKVHNCIIIGSGVAGLTAGIYLGRAKLNPLIIEGILFGGQLSTTYKVENYPGVEQIEGPELIEIMRKQAISFGCKFIYDTVLTMDIDNNIFCLTTENNTFLSKSIVVATGSSHRKLLVPGEDEFHNKGVFSCFTCDGAFYEDRKVVVVGGGDTAFEACLYLSKICSEIILVHRSEKFRGSAILFERVKKLENVKIITNSNVTKINGDDLVTSVTINNDYEIECSGVCVCVGHTPNTKIFENILPLNNNGYIKKEEIKINGLFVCGDCCDPIYQQAVIAAGSGSIAAIDCTKYLNTLDVNTTNFFFSIKIKTKSDLIKQIRYLNEYIDESDNQIIVIFLLFSYGYIILYYYLRYLFSRWY